MTLTQNQAHSERVVLPQVFFIATLTNRASQELSMIDRISLTEDLVFMLPGRLRLRTERGVEAPLEEAEYGDDDDAEDLSNLLRMSLCAPELETRRTTGLRPGVVLRSGMLAAAARRSPDRQSIDRVIGSVESRRRTESKSAPQIHPSPRRRPPPPRPSPLSLPRFICWLLARCLPIQSSPSPSSYILPPVRPPM